MVATTRRGTSPVVAINSNDIDNYPADGPAKMKEESQFRGYNFPYLLDEDQSVAKAYRAACTPDFYVFDGDRKLVYRGQLDDSRPSNGEPVDGHDLRSAIDAALASEPRDGQAKAEHRLQHQVEIRQRAGLFLSALTWAYRARLPRP